MLLLRLWNYIRGYVIILVEGFFLEKFINICIHRQIFLWDIKKYKNSNMRLKVSIPGFKMLKPVARKTNCRIRIVKKCGMPFVLSRYRRRKAFVIGAAAFIVIIYTLTSFIWAVEISGNRMIATEVLRQKLESFGLKPGIIKFGIDTKKIANDMMIEVNEIAWIGVTVKGTKLKIEVAERRQPPELVARDVPCDIVAARDGVVKTIVVKAGQEMVKIGDTVMHGQVLISGTVKNKDEQAQPRLVHAIGSVKARTWYEARNTVNTTVQYKERTGNKEYQYSLVLFAREFSMPNKNIPFENFEKIETRKKVSLGKDLELPFELVINEYYENSISEKEIDIEEARKNAMDEAYKEASKDITEDMEIVNTDMNFVQDTEGRQEAVVVIECLEEIGFTKEIGGN